MRNQEHLLNTLETSSVHHPTEERAELKLTFGIFNEGFELPHFRECKPYFFPFSSLSKLGCVWYRGANIILLIDNGWEILHGTENDLVWENSNASESVIQAQMMMKMCHVK